MSKYFHKLEDLIGYLQKKPLTVSISWLKKFLQDGHTSPLIIGISYEQYRSSLIKDMYLLSKNIEWRDKLRNAIKKIYEMTPLSEFDDYAFIELLKCVVAFNITELKQDLYAKAREGYFKNKKSPVLPDFMDMHNVILRALFGLKHFSEKEINDSINIAECDILDIKYKLECFHFFKNTHGYNMKCVDYIPDLLHLCESKERDYFSVLSDYWKSLSENNQCEITKKLFSQLDEKMKFTFLDLLDFTKSNKPIRLFIKLCNKEIKKIEDPMHFLMAA